MSWKSEITKRGTAVDPFGDCSSFNAFIGIYQSVDLRVRYDAVQHFCLCDLSTRRGRRKLRGGIAESAASGSGKQNDLFIGEIIRLKERIDDRRRNIPPDRESEVYRVVSQSHLK